MKIKMETMNKDIKNLEFKLTDMIEVKFAFIQNVLQKDTNELKATFQKMVKDLESATREFNENFEEKYKTLKNMCANFFAKIQNLSDISNKKVAELDLSNS